MASVARRIRCSVTRFCPSILAELDDVLDRPMSSQAGLSPPRLSETKLANQLDNRDPAQELARPPRRSRVRFGRNHQVLSSSYARFELVQPSTTCKNVSGSSTYGVWLDFSKWWIVAAGGRTAVDQATGGATKS